ncbi:thiamine pyrophosphate-dependent dehydrogenase E1 component subunit alpha [Pseudonocardia alaniniphila]|uniref:Thiamine pyrophosphate-dependent dehydrogenase E1 component subunit alpha n=1 Tax=Pseudonocardia alaniniphila TaxID=75291 RepID=A0ABS9T834_9PSEU|nr:thiamine pyrophosphate-dependent dehydrogenase E1 component subunit alpha [Pseudonocardia alaniniphila]MCH6164466.1 thiamine pyrophosphate-dependent dehydrogenase E1 component subunit alpha [Pseudonocardia alaniniphila]
MSGLPSERLVELYTQMVRIREFEERVKRTFAEHPGVIRGHTHLADGAEASIVGSIAAIGDGDQLMATYRCHGYPIALGSDTAAMMAEIYGRSTGTCKGYGGSMHLADPDRGFLGTSGIVGQNIPQGTGAAYAAQLRGRGEVVLTFFGDGASKQGAFHESLNIAAVWKLPVIFIMENNSFSATVRTEQEDANAAAGEPLSMKAKAYSIPGVTIDGSDVLAVHEAVSAAVARARAGDGPTLIESRVYRLSAHGNSIAPPGVPLHYPEHEAISKYGAVEEYEAAKRGDPIPRLRAHLVETGALTAERATEIIEAAQAEMQRAVEFGLESPYPEPHEALAYVHA